MADNLTPNLACADEPITQASEQQENREDGSWEATKSVVSELTAQVGQETAASVLSPREEEPPFTADSIEEVITTTSCEDAVLSESVGNDGSVTAAERQVEVFNFVSQEDILSIATSLADFAGNQGVYAAIGTNGTTNTREDEENMASIEGSKEQGESEELGKDPEPVKEAGSKELESEAMESGGVEQGDNETTNLEKEAERLISSNTSLGKRPLADIDQHDVGSTEILPPSSKRRSYGSDFKLEVVAYAARTSKNEASRHYMVNRKRIQDWTKQKEALEASLLMGVSRKRLEGGGRKAKHPEIEEAVAAWVREQWEKKEVVTRDMIKRKARVLHQESYEGDQFCASEGWLNRFMQRNGISLRGPTHTPVKTRSPSQKAGSKEIVSVQLPWIIDLEPSS